MRDALVYVSDLVDVYLLVPNTISTAGQMA